MTCTRVTDADSVMGSSWGWRPIEQAAAQIRLVPPRRRHRLAQGLFRREFSPTDNRNHDPDQRRDRTSDGPGSGVAHLATTKHSESLERPDQTEHCEDESDRECNDENPSHIGMLRAGEGGGHENARGRVRQGVSHGATY